MSPEFFLTSLIVALLPGTGVLFTISTGLSRGGRMGFVAAVGCTLGIVPHMLAAMLGLAAVLQASGELFEAVKLAGVGYLLYLAWATWRQTGSLKLEEERRTTAAWRVITSAILINLLNPKLTIFFFASLPQFAAPAPAGLRRCCCSAASSWRSP